MKKKDIYDFALEKSFEESERKFRSKVYIIVPSRNEGKDTFSCLDEDDKEIEGYNVSYEHDYKNKRKGGFLKRLFR